MKTKKRIVLKRPKKIVKSTYPDLPDPMSHGLRW